MIRFMKYITPRGNVAECAESHAYGGQTVVYEENERNCPRVELTVKAGYVQAKYDLLAHVNPTAIIYAR